MTHRWDRYAIQNFCLYTKAKHREYRRGSHHQHIKTHYCITGYCMYLLANSFYLL